MELEKNYLKIKRNSSNMFRNRIIAALVLFCTCNIIAQAQVWTMILEGLISAAEEYSYQMDLDAQIEQEVKQAVGKLNAIGFERTELNKVHESYDMFTKSSSIIKNEMINCVHSFFYTMKNVEFDEIANGIVSDSSAQYRVSLTEKLEINTLEDILNKITIDSLKVYGGEKYAKNLLKDIQKDKRIGYILNTNPQALRIYINSIDSDMRMNPGHLSYWSTCNTNKHIVNSPKDIRLLNPFMLEFKDKNIFRNGELVARNEGNKLYVKDIDMMNLPPKPKTLYQYGNIVYYTDAIGRVVKVEQTINKDSKGKCEQKSKLKAKNFTPLKATKELSKAYNLGIVSYMAPECYINTVYIENSSDNKTAIKEIKKGIKKSSSSRNSTKIVTDVNYVGGSLYCKQLTVSIDGVPIATIVNN